MLDCSIKDQFLLLLLTAVGFFVGFYISPKVVDVRLQELVSAMENKLIIFQKIHNDTAQLAKKRNLEMDNVLIKFGTVLNTRAELSKHLNQAVRDLHILQCSIRDSVSNKRVINKYLL